MHFCISQKTTVCYHFELKSPKYPLGILNLSLTSSGNSSPKLETDSERKVENRNMIGKAITTLVAATWLFKASFGAISDHEIKSLPGWDGSLPSKQYSGLLEIPNTNPARFYHYWLVTSENDPANDPIVLWLNGGPGASSLLGYFTEQGPFHVNDDSIIENTTEIPVLFYNNYTWAKVVNIIFLGMTYSQNTKHISNYIFCCN